MGQTSEHSKSRRNSVSTNKSYSKETNLRPSTFLLEPNKVPESRWLMTPVDEDNTSASASLLSSPQPQIPPPPIPVKSTSKRLTTSTKNNSHLNRWRSFGVSKEILYFGLKSVCTTYKILPTFHTYCGCQSLPPVGTIKYNLIYWF